MLRLIDIVAQGRAPGFKFHTINCPRPSEVRHGKRLVVTLATGMKVHKLLASSAPMMESYAERVGAEFLAITGEIRNPNFPILDKFLLSHVGEYEEVLFIDADIVLTRHTPNYFEMVPAGRLGIFSIDKILESNNEMVVYRSETEILAALQGVHYRPGPFYNSGFVVGSGELVSKFFALPPKLFPVVGPLPEEQWCNVNVQRFGIDVFPLPAEQLWLWVYDKDLVSLDLMKHTVVHFAGMSGYHEWRDRLVRLCHRFWKDQK